MYVQVKVVVIHHGVDEQVHRLAVAATDGAWDAGAEVRIRRVGRHVPADGVRERPGWSEWPEALRETRCIPEVAPADLEWADVVLVGTAAPDRALLERLAHLVEAAAPWPDARSAERVFGTFTPDAPVRGATDAGCASLLDAFHRLGGVVVPLASPPEGDLAAARRQGERATETARALKAGRRVLAEVA